MKKIVISVLLYGFIVSIFSCNAKTIKPDSIVGKWNCNGKKYIVHNENIIFDIVEDFVGKDSIFDIYEMLEYQIYEDNIFLIKRLYQKERNHDNVMSINKPIKTIGYAISYYKIKMANINKIYIKKIKYKNTNTSEEYLGDKKWMECGRDKLNKKDENEIKKSFNEKYNSTILSDKTPLPKFSAKDLE